MTKTLLATFDGSVLRPDEPIELPPNTRVVVTVTPQTKSASGAQSFLEVAQSLHLEGPPDWSERVDDYLHADRIAEHD